MQSKKEEAKLKKTIVKMEGDMSEMKIEMNTLKRENEQKFEKLSKS